MSLVKEHNKFHATDFVGLKGTGFNLGVKIFSSSDRARIYPCRISVPVNSADASTCGKSTSPLEKKDPLQVWQEMKQNGFLSTSLGRIPTPKKSDKKLNGKMKIRKVEKVNRLTREEKVNRLTKVEKVNRFIGVEKVSQINKVGKVNRFNKIAPPSGLLNELRPGIINRVRNSEQVHLTLQAILRREMLENENVQSKQAGQLRESDVIECVKMESEDERVDDDSGTTARRIEHEDDEEELKSLSSVSMASEKASFVSNEESTNPEGVSSVPKKDAAVASHWLQLLHRDITGRLAALKHSRMRIQDVIQIEIPFLLSKEFSPNQENDHSAAGCPITATRDLHQAKWNSLFNQMDKALYEEANQLEIWLNQVTEMQLHYEQGFQCTNWNAIHYLQQPSISDCDTRLMAASNLQST